MKKISSTLLALCFLCTGSLAFAQQYRMEQRENMDKGAMMKDDASMKDQHKEKDAGIDY